MREITQKQLVKGRRLEVNLWGPKEDQTWSMEGSRPNCPYSGWTLKRKEAGGPSGPHACGPITWKWLCWPAGHQNVIKINKELVTQSPSRLPTAMHLCEEKAHGLSERVNARYSMVANFFFTIISLDASSWWCIDQWTNGSDMMLDCTHKRCWCQSGGIDIGLQWLAFSIDSASAPFKQATWRWEWKKKKTN